MANVSAARWVTWVLLPVLAAVSPLRARAEPARTSLAAVVPVGDPPSLGADVVGWSKEFQEALQKMGRGPLGEQDKARLLGFTSASYGDLDSAYAQARAKAAAGDYAEAARVMRSVVEGLERLFGHADVFPRWSRAMLQLGRLEQVLSRHEEARRVVERLVKADPVVVPDPDVFPPSYVSMFEQVRAEVRKRPRSRLVISAGTQAGTIFVEGREVGAGGVALNVPPGTYGVRVVVGDVHLKERKVTLDAGEVKVQFDSALAGALRRQSLVGLVAAETDRRRLAVELGALLGVDRVYVIAASHTGSGRHLAAEVLDRASACTLQAARLRLASSGPPPGGIAALAGLLEKGEESPLLELGLLQRVEPDAGHGCARQDAAAQAPPRAAAAGSRPTPAASQRATPASKQPAGKSARVRCSSQLDCAEAGGLCYDGFCRK